MSINNKFNDAVRDIPTDSILAGFLTVLAIYAFVEAQSFPPRARMFPQIAASIIILSAAIRVAMRVLPWEVARVENAMLAAGSEEAVEVPEEEQNYLNMFVLGALIAFYIVGGFFVGLFWVTPVFVLGYTLYTGQPKWIVAVLTVGLTLVAYGFMRIMHLSLMSGGF